MKESKKNPETKRLLKELGEAGTLVPAWKAVARGLARPRRIGYEMDLARLEKNGKKGDSIVVPGVVLGRGEISKPLTVAALRFSGSAREKIEKAGGKCLAIDEMMKQNPEAKKIRIMG